MATFYTGPRPVLAGQNTNDMVNVFKGTAGTYSYYPYFSTSHVLGGFPDRAHTPGTGYFPGDVFMSQLFTGSVFYVHPLNDAPDGTATYDGVRFRPMEYKGLVGAKAFPSSFGHEERENDYKVRQYTFKGVASAQVMTSVGHGYRTDSEGAPNSYSFFQPDEFHGIDSAKVFDSSYGQEYGTTDYGQQRVQEWAGVPSAKAL
jgi:hypothetical protein